MTVESLAPVRARAAERLLEQHIIRCPGCEKPAAVHIDGTDVPAGARPVVVRLVCPEGCVVPAADIVGRVPVDSWSADAPMTA